MEISRPWTGRTSEGAGQDAGPYSAQNWQEVWEMWFGQNKTNRGVLRGVDNELAVTASSPADTNVNINTGAASVRGIFYLNNASVVVPLTSNSSGSVRIDIIALEADYTAQTVRITVVQGTPGAGVPALTQSVGSIWQIPLAYITLASGFTSIATSAITDLREYANIPSAVGQNVTNDSAVTLEIGSVVIWDSAGNADINTTTTEGHQSSAGIIESRIAAAAAGRIITHGIVPVLCDESVAVGNLLTTSTTAGQAQKATANSSMIFGRVLVANTGAGTRCLAYVAFPVFVPTIFTGSYSGDNAATKAITGVGFKPRKVEIHSSASANPGLLYCMRTDQDAGNNAVVIGVDGGGIVFTYTTDAIVSLDNDGFTVGDSTPIGTNLTNSNTRSYYFACYR